jgi:hypothetical protein
MLKSLASYKQPNDYGASIDISISGREDNDILVSILIEDYKGDGASIELTKWHFNQLIQEALHRLQKF